MIPCAGEEQPVLFMLQNTEEAKVLGCDYLHLHAAVLQYKRAESLQLKGQKVNGEISVDEKPLEGDFLSCTQHPQAST